jgi:hypothetical protein
VLFCPILNKLEVCKNHIQSKLARYGTKIQSIGDALFHTDGRHDEVSNRYMLGERAQRTIISLNGIHCFINAVETRRFACEGGTTVLNVRVDMEFVYKVICVC